MAKPGGELIAGASRLSVTPARKRPAATPEPTQVRLVEALERVSAGELVAADEQVLLRSFAKWESAHRRRCSSRTQSLDSVRARADGSTVAGSLHAGGLAEPARVSARTAERSRLSGRTRSRRLLFFEVPERALFSMSRSVDRSERAVRRLSPATTGSSARFVVAMR